MIEFVLAVASLSLACSSYLIWPSRWNIHAHLALGLWIVSAALPLLLLDVLDRFPQDAVEKYTMLMLLGASSHLAGVLLGGGVYRPSLRAKSTWDTYATDKGVLHRSLERRLLVTVLACSLMLILAYLIMGFVPLLADDPLSAKFFRGPYALAYQQAALPFRFSTAVLSSLSAVVLMYAFLRRQALLFFASVVTVLLLVTTLQRTTAFLGPLTFAMLVLAAKRRTGWLVILVTISYLGGTLAYATLDYAGISVLGERAKVPLLESLTATAPDLQDSIYLLRRFELTGADFTMGKTFLGGLVPGNYRWNPGIWTLNLGYAQTAFHDVASGGLRLPAPLWGYTAFGSTGAVAVPFVSGLLLGLVAKKASLSIGKSDLAMNAWFSMLYFSVISLVVQFYTANYLEVVKLAVILCILFAYPRIEASATELRAKK